MTPYDNPELMPVASRSSRFNFGVRTPDSHRIRDFVGPRSYLCTVNKGIFAASAGSRPQFH
jgi:hypothetical protein